MSTALMVEMSVSERDCADLMPGEGAQDSSECVDGPAVYKHVSDEEDIDHIERRERELEYTREDLFEG